MVVCIRDHSINGTHDLHRVWKLLMYDGHLCEDVCPAGVSSQHMTASHVLLQCTPLIE